MTEILRRPGRTLLAFVVVLALLVAGSCSDPDNSGSDYKPSPGNNTWGR